MYYVAICDDDPVFVSYIKKIINQCYGDKVNGLIFYEFHSGEELIERIGDLQQISLIILDMELGKIDGDTVARHFRSKFKESVLVFCSGVRTPTVTSFKASPYRYLLKSYTDQQLLDEMKDILKEMERKAKKEYITGHYRSSVIRVDLNNIEYIENAKRGSKIIVCRNCDEAKFEAPIFVDEKLEVLSAKYSNLVFAHSSYIINIDHIEKIIDNYVYLDNGECLSASRTYQKNVRESFTKSIAGKYK